MTSFVSLTHDDDSDNVTRQVSVQLGEWLLEKVVKTRDPEAATRFVNDYGEFFQSHNHASMIETLLKHQEMIFAEISASEPADHHKVAREVEGFFTALWSMLLNLPDEQIGPWGLKLMKILTSAKEHPDIRLRLTMSLFNFLLPLNSSGQQLNQQLHAILSAILTYSSETKHFEVIAPYVPYLCDWMDALHFDIPQKRNLLLETSHNLKSMHKAMDAYSMLNTHLKLYQEDKTNLKASTDAAVEFSVDSITLSQVKKFDTVLELEAIKHLSTISEHENLVKLLKIFVNGRVGDLMEFFKSNNNIQKYGISEETCMSRLRLLSLASLGAEVQPGELDFETVAKALQVKPDEVETWMVQAIGQGLLDGRIDQMRKTVLIKYAFPREFNKDHWLSLRRQIKMWQENIQNIAVTYNVPSA